jgi:putative thiamine transport system permease protein
MLKLAPVTAITLLLFPVLAGLLGVIIPAAGWPGTFGSGPTASAPWERLFAEPGLWRSVVVSFASGLATAAVSLACVSLLLAGFSGRPIFIWARRALSPLLSVPHAAAAYGVAFLIAPSGIIFRALSPWATGLMQPPDLLIVHDSWGLAMMAGLIVKEIPFLLLVSLAALPQIDAARRLAMARSLGYRRVAAWLKAVAPGLYPLIRLPVFAVIAYASSTVDVALILGPTNPPPLSIVVIRWLNDPDLGMRSVSAAGAVLQLLVTFAALLVWRLGELAVARSGHRWIERGRRSFCDGALRALGASAISTVLALAVLGLASLAIWSLAGAWRFPALRPEALTLKHWQDAAPSLPAPLIATMLVGLLSTAVSLVVVVAALEHEHRHARPAGRLAMMVLYLPLVVPQVAFLFGLVVAEELCGIRPGFWPVVLGHIVFVLPYVYLSLSEAYRRLDPAWTRIARSLGASPSQAFWRVRLPLLLTPCLTAAALGIAVSVGQYLATQLLGAGRLPTVTTEAVALASGDDRRVIGVWALTQALLPALGFGFAIVLPRLLWRNRRQMRDIG